uniref:JmjC domain-containing protein n=1 Tax=Haptolina ericina TaxID=156174 RepID=A0A7S3EPW7_9EUKA
MPAIKYARLTMNDPPASYHPCAVRCLPQVYGTKHWLLCPPGTAGLYCDGTVDGFSPDFTACPAFQDARCTETVLHPGAGLFYPEGWWHQTRTVGLASLSISRSLLTPSNARDFAVSMRAYCAEALALAHRSYSRLCASLEPCLQRLTMTEPSAS